MVQVLLDKFCFYPLRDGLASLFASDLRGVDCEESDQAEESRNRREVNQKLGYKNIILHE